MCFVLKNNFDYLRYLTYLIGSSVYIIDWYGSRQLVGIQTVFVNKISIDKNASNSRVNQNLCKEILVIIT